MRVVRHGSGLPMSDVREDTVDGSPARDSSRPVAPAGLKSFPLLVDSQLVLQYFLSHVKVYWEEKILYD
jgi:hypothetical protein